MRSKIFCTSCIILNLIEFELILQVSWEITRFINNNVWFIIEMREFKLLIFNIRSISLLFSLFFFKFSSKFLSISSESITFNLFCHCCNISNNTWWKSDVVSEIKKFLDRMKTLSDKEFVSETLQAWFILINKKISAAFWLLKSAHLSQMIENVNCSVSRSTKSWMNSENSSSLLSLLLLSSLLSRFS